MLSPHRFSLRSSGANLRSLDLVLFAIGENGVEVRDVLVSSSVDSNCDLKLETDSASVLSAEVRVYRTILRFFELTSYYFICL